MKVENARGAIRVDQALSTDATPLRAARHLWLRRLGFWGPVLAATVAGTALAALATAGVEGPFRLVLLALVAANLLYMALTGVPGVIGFVLHLSGRRLRASAVPNGLSRTAVLMPVHKEDPTAVFAAIETMMRGVAEAGLLHVDLHVLSDTQDPAIATAEQAAYAAALARAPQGVGLFYRRRPSNAGRKVGNLAEFCDRRGAEYDYMIVLDADSLMSAGALGRLIGLMDANPRTGIIQTVPYPVGRETLFARLQQFAARLYTPLLVEGLTWWQQADGNYWGHNAIIRIAPFRAHCAMPVLPGREPWGGEILCHDVVEAGLMRGAGWDVWVLPEVLESYEAVPANIVDFIARERRWCQGNLQHKGLLRHAGLRAVGRFHLAYGITHYVAGPVSVLFLMLAVVDGVLGYGFVHALLAGGAASAGVVAIGFALLYAGKLTSLVAALADRDEAARYGGRAALLGSAALEQASAFAVSAMLMVAYSKFVFDLLCGRSVRWDVQARDDRGVSWREAWLRLRGPTLAGAAWLLALPLLPLAVAMWSLPLLAGLLAVCPLAVWSSRTTLGAHARQARLLLTPDELAPPPVLRAYTRTLLTGVSAPAPYPAPARLHLAAQAADGD